MKYFVIFLALIFTIAVTTNPISVQAQNPNMKVEAPTLNPEDYRKGETLSNTWVAIVIEGLGAALIVLFIVIYAIKRKAKGVSKHDNN
jgi:hypothetical protein